MSWGNEFVELDKSIHDRMSFDCGEKELNLFLQSQAARHMKAGISKTMLLPDTDLIAGKHPVCAFYTIAPSSIKRADLPEKMAKKLPHYPIPVFLLAQLAVHSEHQGKGLGKITLIKALEYFWGVQSAMPSYAVIVDCLNVEAEEFYKKYGFNILCYQNEKAKMFIPMKKIELLFSK